MGFGVAISLLLAILVLAFANSSLRVCGFSGSKRIPYMGRKETHTRTHTVNYHPHRGPQKQARLYDFPTQGYSTGKLVSLGNDTFTNQAAKDPALGRVGNTNPRVYWVCSRGRSAVDRTGPINLVRERHVLCLLTFNAFLAASAPARLSKITKPTG